MLISGGKVLAIDKVKHGNTLTGDGAFGELDVNTNVIATVASVSSISSTLDKKIDTASANLSAEIDKKEDKITYHYNAFNKIDKINGSALAGGNNVELEEGDNIKITPRQVGENVIYNISTPSYTSKDESLLKVDEYSLSAKNWLPEIKESSANAVDVVSANFGDTSNGITGYNGIGLYIPAQKDIVGGKSINVVTGTNNFTINLDTSADVVAYSAGYGLNLANHEFSVEYGFFALSSEVYNKVEVNELLANFGGFVIVTQLPETGDNKKIYLIKDESVPGEDKYKEYIFTNNGRVCIGDTSIDLTDYATSAWVIQNFLSANALDFMSSVSSQWNDVSSKLNTSDFNTWSANADITPYTGIDPIKVEGYEISLTADYLSANALDKIKEASANWNSVYETVNTTSGDWNEVSSKADKTDLDDLSGKVETLLPTVESLTPDYLKVDLVENQDGTSAWQLSAAKQKNFQAGDYIDIDENDKINVTGLHNVTLSSTDESIGITATTGVNGDVNYNLSVDQIEVPNISGYNGISATFNKETNQYEVGFKENDYAYLFGHYGNNSTVTDGTILKLDSNNYYKITIDNDGYITLPQTTNKFTFCINEYIDDNTTQNHEYLLNKLVLSAKNSDSIVTSQNYYPSEVGSSNVTLALTIDNSISPKEYCIVYKGSDVAANKLKIEASILEEVTSLDSSRGDVDDYTGREPIRIVQNSRVVELLYDEDVFTLKEDASLGAKKLTIESKGGEVVDKNVFDKLLNSINGRITETIPFGALNTVSDIAGQYQYAYLFRPTIEYDMTQNTQAYMMGGNADANEYVSVAVYQGVAGSSNLLWESGYTLIPTSGGQVVMDARVGSPSATITPDSLYYVCVRVDKLNEHGGTWHNVLGLSMGANITTDIGNPKPWVGQTNIPNLDYPSTQDFAYGSMSDFGGTKPYVGFRTKETNN